MQKSWEFLVCYFPCINSRKYFPFDKRIHLAYQFDYCSDFWKLVHSSFIEGKRSLFMLQLYHSWPCNRAFWSINLIFTLIIFPFYKCNVFLKLIHKLEPRLLLQFIEKKSFRLELQIYWTAQQCPEIRSI